MLEEYEQLIEKSTIEFKGTLPDAEKEVLSTAFENHLSNTVLYLLNPIFNFEITKSNIINVINKLKNEISLLDINSKKALLIEDKSYEKLTDLSNELYEKAIDEIQNNQDNFSEKEFAEVSKNLINEFNQVSEYNQEEAKSLCSEAILDAEFLLKNNIDIMSLRLGRFYESLKENKTK